MRRPSSRLAADIKGLLLALLLACAPSLEARAACEPAPLKQPGKTQLLDRVLVRPGATLTSAAGAPGGQVLAAFSVLYVYGRSPDGGAVQVGASSACKPQGWVKADGLVPWRHVMVAAFTSRSGRQPVLFFKGADQLKPILAAPDTQAEAARLQVAAGSNPAAAGIVAREPETPVDLAKQFYLLPVLEASSHRFGSQAPVRVLHVASLTKQPAADTGGRAAGPEVAPHAGGAPAAMIPASGERHNFRTAVVFVMDATMSMDPYLARVRQSLDHIYQRIEAQHLQDQVRFGLVAFRDDPKAVRGIGYGTRVFVDPNLIATRAQFDQAVAGLDAARVSSRAVAEDVYAGVAAGIDDIDWSGFDGRFLVLVTDASAREPNSGIVATHLDNNALALMAREKAIAVLALHLLTPEGGAGDHSTAQRQYTTLTQFPGRESLYYPVPAGDVNEYGKRLDTIADSLVQLITTAEDKGTARVDAPPAPSPPHATKVPDASAPAADIQAVGYAMRLAYLGKINGAQAPTMFDAWALDRDMVNQTVRTLDIRVLLSRSQLSDLAATTQALYDTYQRGRDDPDTFYKQLRSAALTLSRDPTKIGAASNRELSQDILGEYLDGLPYASRVMALSQDDWLSLSPSEQQELIDDMAVKLQLYRRMEDDTSHWVDLAPGSDADDSVYPVPVDALP